jgi:hypothetical protein
MEKLNYQNWPNCYKISNGEVELIVTTDIGPRVIRFGFVGERNEFHEFQETLGKTGGNEWNNYGGHRLWLAPEEFPRSYPADNFQVKIEKVGKAVRLTPDLEDTTRIQKQMDIELSDKGSHVKVTHRMTNKNMWAVDFAPWALTVMDRGAKIVIPLPPRKNQKEALLPVNMLGLWAYTDMTDSRWTWGRKYIMLQQDSAKPDPQKVGAMVPDGWLAVANNGHLFVKKFDFVPGAAYPDFGCSVETFTNDEMLEAETVAPMVTLEPGRSVEYVEHWFLFKNVPVPMTDADVDKNILPIVLSAKI